MGWGQDAPGLFHLCKTQKGKRAYSVPVSSIWGYQQDSDRKDIALSAGACQHCYHGTEQLLIPSSAACSGCKKRTGLKVELLRLVPAPIWGCPRHRLRLLCCSISPKELGFDCRYFISKLKIFPHCSSLPSAGGGNLGTGKDVLRDNCDGKTQ